MKNHLQKGGHISGVFILRSHFSFGQIIDELLLLIWEAGIPEEYRDRRSAGSVCCFSLIFRDVMLGYTLWRKEHFKKIDRILEELIDVGVSSITIVAAYAMESDTDPTISTVGNPFFTPDKVPKILERVKKTGLRTVLKPQFHPKKSHGKMPHWWPGYIGSVRMDWDKFFTEISDKMTQCMEWGREFDVDSFIVGTELCSTVTQSGWEDLIHKLRREMPYALLTWGHNFWMPILWNYYWIFRLAAVIYGAGDVLKMLMSGTGYEIPQSQRDTVGKTILNTKGLFPKQNMLDFLSIGAYWYPTMKRKYTESELIELWNNYTRYHITVSYLDSIESWASKINQPLEISEADIVGSLSVRNDFEYYTLWWKVLILLFSERVKRITAWEDGAYGKWVEAMRQIY